MRARYAVEPLGHYGLAKKKYTHFTSPIRRYADLVVHRALFQQQGQRVTERPLKEVAEHISETERNSDDAERDSRDVKMFAFLNAQLKSPQPPVYPALVTDVRNFGFFVDVTGLGMSGLVPLSGLSDDFYQFDPTRGQLLGRRTRRVFKLGDKVEVQVAKVDTFKKQVDFKLAGTTGDRARRDVKHVRQPQRQPQQKPQQKPRRHEQRPRSEKEARFAPPRSGVAHQAQGQRWHAPHRRGGRRPQRGSGRPQGRPRR